MSDKVRVYEIAEEAGASSQEVIAKAKDLNIDLKSPQSAVSYEDAEEITKYIMTGKSSRLPNKPASKAKKVVEKKILETTETIVIKKPELKKVQISKPNVKSLNSTIDFFEADELDINNIGLEIKNLKQIKILEFDITLKKGIYAIIGNNGVGKSSLITCLGKLVEPNCLREEFKGNNSYIETKIIYKIRDRNIEWTKPKNWTVSSNNNIDMPRFNGIFEASLITGQRFNHIEHKYKTIQQNQLKHTIKVDEFIIENLDYILNGIRTKKYDEMYYMSNSKVKELYFIKYGNDFITEFYFSAGEYFLLSILKFINIFKNRKNKNNLGVIIIDEIEISLHPLAQKRLIERLKRFRDEYNLLIIFATHSLQIVDELEPNDIYYFENNDGICTMLNPIHKGYLASRLYQHSHYDKIILVEDDLAIKFITKLIQDINIKYVLYSIIPIGGWEKVIEIYRINKSKKIYSNAEVIAILDGDTQSKEKANKGSYSDIEKRFLPIENIEKYTVTKLFNDNVFIEKVESRFLGYKKLKDLPIIIKTETTNDIKLTFKKGIIEEIQTASGKGVHVLQIEDLIIDEIINKLKKEDNEKLEKFKEYILNFLK